MKNRPKTQLHMHLPQTENSESNLYELFRKRVLTKNKDAFVDKGKNPVRLILNINHPVFDTQVGVIVQYQSFKPIYGSSESKNVEIGFEAVVYSGFSKDTYMLRVFKNKKAYLELITE